LLQTRNRRVLARRLGFALGFGVIAHQPALAGQSLALACRSDAAPAVAFRVSVVFDDGALLALTDPQTGKIEQLVYDQEVLGGTFQREAGSLQPMIFTRTSGAAGRLTGTFIDSNGSISALSIERFDPADGSRRFVYFSTDEAMALRGRCR
jgi:hypothetical protein